MPRLPEGYVPGEAAIETSLDGAVAALPRGTTGRPIDRAAAAFTARAEVAHAWLLEAAARDALGETAAAEAALEHALALAESGGVLVPFLFHRAPELLERHARHCPAHADLISRILTLLT